MRKVVNLDDKQSAVEITLGGAKWEISRVVLRLKEMYADYYQEAADYIEFVTDDSLSDDDRYQAAEEYAVKKAQIIDDMMKKLLTDNGYKYDKEWWADNVADYQAMESFIVAAINKDRVESDKKKAVTS